MNVTSTSASALPAACQDLFTREGLPSPVVPVAIADSLQPAGEFAFATRGWPAGSSLDEAVEAWLAQPADTAGFVGFTGHGVVSMAVRVCIATPDAGWFMQRRWSQAFGEEAVSRQRISGAFAFLRRAMDAAQALRTAGRWPAGNRLLLVDDDFASRRWGWIAAGEAGLDGLATDPSSYLNVLAELEQRNQPTPA